MRFIKNYGKRKRVSGSCALLWMIFLFPGWSVAQRATHVIVVSIDGFRPDFYRQARWGMVNLREMAARGVSADGVNSVFPTLTFPNHTTIITGVRPAVHGIYYNDPFSGDKQPEEWYWYARDIRSLTLWQAVRQAGGVVASVNWPVSVGAPVDYNIPIVKKNGMSQLEVTAMDAQPKGLMEEVEEYATGKLDDSTFNTGKDYLMMDENVSRIAGYLFRRYKPAFMTVRLSCTDHFEHLQGRDGNLVRRAVAGADRALRTILEYVDMAGLTDSTAIIVTGDHGFVDVHTVYAPNTWLAKAGLITDISKGEWKAQFKPAGGSAFLYLRDPDDAKTLQKVMQLLRQQQDHRNWFRVISRHELDSMQCDPRAALALAAQPGYIFAAAFKGPETRPIKKGTHGFFPDFREIQTGFVACGPGLQKAVVIPEMSLTNIAPLVAKLLGVPWAGPHSPGESAFLRLSLR